MGAELSAANRHRFRQRLEGLLFYLLLLLAIGLAGWLSQRYQGVYDWTDRARNSLTGASRQLLERLEAPLLIRSFAPANPQLRQQIRAVIEPYQRHRLDITLEFIDPALQPELTRETGIRRAGELQLSYQERSENLDTLTEQQISNSIQRLIQRGQRWIAGIEGHGERRLIGKANHDLGEFGAELQRKGYRIQALQLSEQPLIPRNIALLVLAGPQVALLPAERQVIRDYLDRGGNLLWLTDPGPQHALPELFPGLDLEILPGTVVDANAAGMGLDNPAIALVTRFPDHPATQRLERVTLYPFAAALKASPGAGWQAISLLQTQPGSWNETSTLSGELRRNAALGEEPGPLTLGYAFSRQLEGTSQRLMVVGDGDFLSNSYLGNGGNLDLGLNLIRWLSGDDNLLDIPARTAPDTRLELSRTAGAAIGLGFLFILPLLLIATGLFIWWRRRRA
ncbi:GldG family protein [Sedimenticola hydrogenitrophicus]|uniref:GldG family protein n=1 Tax=Sedimenticola hydrogenitrophicus TaxID=2967975 RepID=UPI0023B05B0B